MTTSMEGLHRYEARVSFSGSRPIGQFVDWFADDDAARAGYVEILGAQGYQVQRVEITGRDVVVHVRRTNDDYGK